MKSFTISEVLIYNPTLKSMKKKPIESDVQEAKIMAYFPTTAPIQQKCNTVGMAQGVYEFCNALTGQAETQNKSKTQVTFMDGCCLVLEEVEENIWLYIKLSYYQKEQTFAKSEEDEEEFNYMNNSFSQKIALKIIRHFYLSFWTFYGNISAFLFHNDFQQLQQILQYFVKTYEDINKHEQTKKLDASCYLINNIRSIPLDVNSHLKFAYFKNVMESYDPTVTDIIIFSNGLLAYSSLPKEINSFFAHYFYGTGDPYRFDLNAFPKKMKLVEQLMFMNPIQKYGTIFNTLKYGFGDSQILDSRATININYKMKKSEDLLGVEEGEKLAFPVVYMKKNGQECKLHLSCFFEKKMLFLTFFKQISSVSQMIFQNRFYHDNTDKFAIKITEIYNNLLAQTDTYRFLYFNMSTFVGKSTIEKWNNFVPELKYVWQSLEENEEGIVATTYSNHWVYGVHRFNRILILMIPSEIALHKLDQFAEKMAKQYFFKAFM